MRNLLSRSLGWHAGPPAWGPALMAGMGCGLPLLLGLFTSHSGFLWAATGAFQAALATVFVSIAAPLRFAMLIRDSGKTLRQVREFLLKRCAGAAGKHSANAPKAERRRAITDKIG